MGEEEQSAPNVRWYHIAATVAVATLAIVAIITILHRFDASLIGSEHTLQMRATCGDDDGGENRYFGLREGDFYAVDFDKNITRVISADDAVLEIKSFDQTKIEIGTKNSAGEWAESSIGYATEKALELGEKDGCSLKLRYVID